MLISMRYAYISLLGLFQSMIWVSTSVSRKINSLKRDQLLSLKWNTCINSTRKQRNGTLQMKKCGKRQKIFRNSVFSTKHLIPQKKLERVLYASATTRHKTPKIDKNCHYKISLQTVTKLLSQQNVTKIFYYKLSDCDKKSEQNNLNFICFCFPCG